MTHQLFIALLISTIISTLISTVISAGHSADEKPRQKTEEKWLKDFNRFCNDTGMTQADEEELTFFNNCIQENDVSYFNTQLINYTI